MMKTCVKVYVYISTCRVFVGPPEFFCMLYAVGLYCVHALSNSHKGTYYVWVSLHIYMHRISLGMLFLSQRVHYAYLSAVLQ
jgi:hypothetical protein